MSLDVIPTVATAASLAGGAISAPILQRVLWPKPKTTLLRDRILWDRVDDDGKTVRLLGRGGGGGFRVIQLTGRIYNGLTNDTIESLFKGRKSLFDGLTEEPISIRIVTKKSHLPIKTPPISPDGLAQTIDKLWHARFANSFVASHHIILSVSSADQIRRLDHCERLILDQLSDYSPKVLELGEEDASPLLSWLATELNGFELSIPPQSSMLAERLTFANLSFDRHGSITHSDGPNTLHSCALGIRAWPEESTAEVINALMQIPAALKLVIRAAPYTKTTAEIAIGQRARQARLVFYNPRISKQWVEVAEKVNADEEGYFKTEITIYVTDTTLDALNKTVNTVRATLGKNHARAIKETMLTERLWWSQFPDYDYFSRDYHLLSSNLADYTPLKAEPSGRTSCIWGPHPVRYFPTASGAPYGFVFQNAPKSPDEVPLAHAQIIGPSGQGKSTLMMFLAVGAMSAYPDLRTFVFDRGQGCLVPFACFGGDYLIPEADTLPLNPFLLEDSPEHREFLRLWLQMLMQIDDDAGIDVITTAVNDMMNASPGERLMSKQWQHIFPAKSVYRERIKKWAVNGKYARIFNGERDALHFSGSRLVGFDMTEMHMDPQLSAAITFYFLHRIRQMVKKSPTPHLIFIDEAPAMLQDKFFFQQSEILFREHRKHLGAVVMAAQEPRAFDYDVFRSNSALRIFLQDPNAEESHYQNANLTEAEWAFVKKRDKTYAHLRYAALFKRADESVILDTNLTALGDNLRAFSSSIQDRTELWHLKERYGPRWLREFLRL